MKRVFAITILNNFVSGGLALTIPLLLLDRNVNLAEIGIVISILPLVFLVVRLLFSAFADKLGWASFFILLNWPGTLFSTAIYFFANSTYAFLLGKIVEGVKESSYWAVIRTTIFSLSPKQKAKEATKNHAFILLSNAFGGAVSGLGIAYMGFSHTLGIMIIASTIIGIPAAFLWHTEKRDSRPQDLSAIASLDPRGKGKTFWLVSLTLSLFSLAQYPLITLVLPVFMAQQLRYDYSLIGTVLMLYYLVSSFAAFSTLKMTLGVGRVATQCLIALFAAFLLANSSIYFLSLFLALALVHGLGIGLYEFMIAKAILNRLTVSVDIGLLMIPTRLAEFTSVLFAGFVAQSLGYAPIFAASGIFFTAFSMLSFYVIKKDVKGNLR